MYSSKQYFIGFLLLLCTAVSSWLVLKSSAVPNILSNNNAPDSYMTDVSVMRTNNDSGEVQNQLYAKLMTHYANQTTLFSQPHFVFYHPPAEPWNLTAKQGQAEDGINEVKLWDQVVLAQAAGTQTQPITINTSQVTVHPKQHFAQTKELVTAIEPGVYVTAIGMHVDFKTQIVDLLSHVRVQYQAQANSKPQF